MGERSKLFRLDLSIGLGRHDKKNPNEVYRPNGTDLWLVEFTIEGRGLFRGLDRHFEAEPGRIVLFETGASQDYSLAPGSNTWDHYWACFSPRADWLDWFHWNAPWKGVGVLDIHDIVMRERLETVMEHALEMHRSPHHRRREFVMNALETFFLWCDSVNPNSRDAQIDVRIREAVRFIFTHYKDNIELSDMAKAVGLSVSRFAHLFKDELSQTPMQFLEKHRVEIASEQLRMTRLPITLIASEVGFQNPFYFSSVFKAHTGLSPRAFRKQFE